MRTRGLAKDVRQVLNLRIEVKKKRNKCMRTEVPFTLQKKQGPDPLKSGLDHFF